MGVYNIAKAKARKFNFNCDLKILDKKNLQGYRLDDWGEGIVAMLYFYDEQAGAWELYDWSEPFETFAEARASAREQLRRG